MRKRWKQFAGGMLAAVLALSSLDAGGMTARAEEGNAQDKPWPKSRYELEDGRLFNGEGAEREIQIKSGNQFSKGKAIDTMDHNGQGAGSAIEPVISSEGLYQVILGYSKGRAYAEGKIALYRNEERIGYFLTKTTGVESVQPVVDSDPIVVYLEKGDELSIRTDTGDATDAVACFDYLDISMWGGQYEAENGRLLLEEMKTVSAEGASGNMAVDGFEKTDGAGVEFPFEIPADGTYLLGLGYTRINYELEDKIGVYVGEERVGEVVLRSGGNTGDYIESEQIELELKQGDQITIRESEAAGDKGLLLLDYLKIQPKMQEIAAEDGPAFISALLQVVKGDTLTVPVTNLPGGQKAVYSTSDETVAAVEETTGKITAMGAGTAVITATVGSSSFSCKLQVVDSPEQLAVTVDKYEAEAGELISGDKAAPVIKSGSTFSGGKWVEIYDAGTGAAVKIKPEIEEAGEYLLTMCYAKGSMYPGDSVSVYVNNTKIGDFHMESGGVTDLRNTNTLSAVLKPGDAVMVRKDAGQNSLFRYDYLMVSPVTAIPVRGIEMEEEEAIVTNMETYQVKYTLSPEIATDALVWSSSDPSIAQADGGMIWGRGEGTATITAKSVYNEDIQAQMKVTVTANDKIESIASSAMEVLIDKNYPRVMEYRMISSGNTMDGNTNALDTIQINGKDYKPEVTFEKKGADTAVYTMQVRELNAVLSLQAKVEGTILKFDFLEIKESGDKAQRIYTIELPEQNLVSVSSREERAEFAGSRMQPDITKSGDEYIDLTQAQAAAPGNYNYAFISNGKVAAGIRSNAYSMNDPDQGAPRRVVKETVAEGSAFRTSLRSGSWVWRREDYTKKFITYDEDGNAGDIQTKTYEDQPMEEMPLVYVVLAEDLNGTGTVDWQDAAIRFRDVMYVAIGMDKIPDAVVQRLIMPQAGEGNYPFISSLDETKRVYLNTDGLGQIILDKYHNLGFWGDFSVYDDHLGGLQDFRKFTADATNLYNGFVGVHSNFTEVFAKTNQFSTESIQMNAAGTQPQSKGYKAFGFFLHQCYYADDTWEALSGQRREAMKMFKEDVPELGFIYSDVYYWNGWRGQQLEEDYAANGLAYFVEWPYISEESSPWAHWAVEKDYSPASNKGYSSDIARFIFNHTKDRWDNNAAKCDNQRVPSSCNLLMGADTTSYEGWVHDGVNRYDYIITKVFDNNLPTKYMQHFPILRMDKDEEGWGEHIWFEDGLEVFMKDGKRVMTKDGKVIYTQDAYLIPWDEGDMQVDNSEEEKEVKLYHWNENGGTTTWQLPDSWSGLANVYLYQLTDQGKVGEKSVSVVNGSVTLEGIEARVPYVIYKGEAAPVEDVSYGDGSFVKDPGFNYGDLRAWNLDFGTAEVRRNDTEGDDATTQSKYNGDLRNYELIMDGAEASQVSQTVTGLNGGEEYAASVMVEVEQGKEREASIQVDCGGTTVKNYTTKSILKQYDAYDSKASTYMLRMRVVFKVPEGENSATVRLCAAEGEGKIRFDNVRVYDTTTPTAPEDAVNVVFYQDFEYGKRENAPVREENKVTYESYYPFNLGSAGGIREARAMLQTRHDPYTQNNKNAGWDENTIMVDMALDGNHSLSVITDSLGAAFQTTPQNIRFEKGHTYRISFLYQNALDDTFAFVLGADQNSQAIYQESLKATPAKSGSRTFSYEFTSESDQTWFSINRIDRSVVVSENPNPFVIDNILVEDLSRFYTITAGEPEDGSYVVTVPEQAVEGDEVTVAVEVTDTDRETDQVTARLADGTEITAQKDGDTEYTFVMPAGDVVIVVVLKDRIADKTALSEMIALAEEKQEGNYSADTWGAFAEALAQAKAVQENAAAKPSEADAALKNLEDAMKQLIRLPDEADKTALNAVLDVVVDKEQEQYTEESWEAFAAALATAKQAAENVSATQDEVNAVRKALTDALAGLEEEAESLVNEDLLKAMIVAAATVDGTKFTDDSYAAMVEAKEAAERFAGLRTDEAVTGNENAAGIDSGSTDGENQESNNAGGVADGSADNAILGSNGIGDAANGSMGSENRESNSTGGTEDGNIDDAGQEDKNTGGAEAGEGSEGDLVQGSESKETGNGSEDSAIQESGNADGTESGEGSQGLEECVSTQEAGDGDIKTVIDNLRTALVSLEPVDGSYVDHTFMDAMINLAGSGQEELYTPESWKQMLQAKDAAEKADRNDRKAVNAAAEALSKAIQGLRVKAQEPDIALDWAVLDSLVNAAEGKQETDYTASAWKVLTDALTAAKELPEDANHETLNAAIDALASAIEKLVPTGTVDKAELDGMIQDAEALLQEDYTEESWKMLEEALKAAGLVSVDPDADQAKVDEALENLTAAIEALEKIELPAEADKTALDELIEAVSGKDQDAYTADSWNRFHEALLAAQQVRADENATQQEVDEALAALKEAEAGLVESRPQADKSALQAVIRKADGLKKADYTEESWAELEKALAEAKYVMNDTDAAQEKVSQAAAALQEAIAGLKAAESTKPTGSPKPEESTKPTGSPKPEESAKPTGSPKPEESAKPTGSPKPEESAKPTGSPKPEESAKPTGSPKPEESAGPTGSPKPEESARPTGSPKPVEPTQPPVPTDEPDGTENGKWVTESDGNQYWYEGGVKQGTEGRGKEIYDPKSDAWYWLDSIDGGRKAVNKDVFMESSAGIWAENADGTGKWVRYDADGRMVKGWDSTETGTWYFAPVYGTMAKGYVMIEGELYFFDHITGIGTGQPCGWSTVFGWVIMEDGNCYWYEDGVKQGTEGRGKEIYDPVSDAWYWLDAVDGGKKAVSKDVYMESAAGDWAENPDGTGKWVRYDANGHMVKGWDTTDDGTWYFDLIYGTMAKGTVVIDGNECRFDVITGVQIGKLGRRAQTGHKN